MNTPSFSFPQLAEDERLDKVNEQIYLIQKKKGLTFGTDAFLLAAFVRQSAHTVAVELGGGTGIVSLLLAAKKKVKQITVAEIQPAFAELIDRNARINGYEDRVKALCADVRELNAAKIGREVDLVVSNPPYMKCNAGKRNVEDEKYIARHEVCGQIHDFCAAAGRLLRHGGKFVCVWRPDRLVDLICAMRENNIEPKEMCFVHANTKSEPSMVLVRAKKGASSSVKVCEPLFLNSDDDARMLTERAKKIYEECNF